MCIAIRSILLAVIVAMMILLLSTTPANAQSWSSAQPTGLTSVESWFEDGTYVWLLTNNPTPAEYAYDLLIWNLIPYQVQEPLLTAEPVGVAWEGDRWTFGDTNRKYYTPVVLGPGQSAIFQFTPNPSGFLINAKGPQPEELGFIAHVAAVVKGSGSFDGTVKWERADTPYGYTWYDRSMVGEALYNPIPEPAGVLVLAMGFGTLGMTVVRRRLTAS